MFKEKYNKLQSSIHPTSQLVKQTINKCSYKGENTIKFNFRKLSVAVTAVAVIFVSAVNVSPALAASMDDIPVLASIIRAVSVRTYTEDKENYDVDVNQPIVEGLIDVNKAVEAAIDEYKASAQVSINEYKEAFISTGGTEEEFKEKNIQVKVTHEIKTNNEQYTSFVLEMYEDWLASSARYEYYNLDSKTGEKITLLELLGEDYVAIANKAIQTEIDNAGADSIYFAKDEGGFESITDNTAFYVNEDGNPVIVFNKYEIAAGIAGRPEFEIKK